jgi:three-Cys-motif partner protein
MRNVLWKNPDQVQPSQVARMDAFRGDNSWRETLYKKIPTLFQDFDLEARASNQDVATAYKERLTNVAGFKYVPDPIPMRNTRGAIIYYLFFASANEIGAKIVSHIFDKFRDRGAL